jgi:ribosome-associated protein
MQDGMEEIIDLARYIVDLIADKKGEDIVLLDIRGKTIIADFFVVCSGTSERQLKAIVEGVTTEVKKNYGIHPRAVEGNAETGWVLVDFADIIVHAFSPGTRAYYRLEDFWLEHEATVLLKMQ